MLKFSKLMFFSSTIPGHRAEVFNIKQINLLHEFSVFLKRGSEKHKLQALLPQICQSVPGHPAKLQAAGVNQQILNKMFLALTHELLPATTSSQKKNNNMFLLTCGPPWLSNYHKFPSALFIAALGSATCT